MYVPLLVNLSIIACYLGEGWQSMIATYVFMFDVRGASLFDLLYIFDSSVSLVAI